MSKMDKTGSNLHHNFPRETLQLRILLLLTVIFLVAGLISPIITLKKYILLENTFSVLSGVVELLKEGQYFLFVLITAFSIVLPFLKLAVLYLLLANRYVGTKYMEKYLHWMHVYGKWSMLDVFVVAVLVVAVKLGAIASVDMRFGLYAFATAVLLTMYITARVVSLSDKLSIQ